MNNGESMIKRYVSTKLNANCYLYSNDKISYMVIVDPCVEYDIMVSQAYKPIKYVLITHGHYDHIKEIRTYLNKNITFIMDKNAITKLENDKLNLSKYITKSFTIKEEELGKVLYVSNGIYKLEDDLNLEVIETKGHSDCSLSYLIDNILFTGDFILKGSVGRSDFITGNQNTMNISIMNIKMNSKVRNALIYPGHGDETTMLYELKTNPFLR